MSTMTNHNLTTPVGLFHQRGAGTKKKKAKKAVAKKGSKKQSKAANTNKKRKSSKGNTKKANKTKKSKCPCKRHKCNGIFCFFH